MLPPAMSVLPILTRDERNGVVFVEDKREDGTVVVLRCAKEAGGGVGVPSTKPRNKVFPMLLAMDTQREGPNVLFPTDFYLVVDTSELPAGQLEFEIGPFIERVQEAVDAGRPGVQLNPKEAREWGLRARGLDD